jgi:hypothetical protein
MIRFSEMLKGKQHKLDKNKNGKLDAHDFKLIRKEETEEISEDHFKLGDTVKCKASGMKGKVVKLDEPSGPDDKEYYTVEREDGKTMKYAPKDLTLVEGIKPGQGSKPGWMLKADPELKKKIDANKAKYQAMKKALGNPSAGVSVKEESKDEADEVARSDYKTTPSGRKSHKYIKFSKQDNNMRDFREEEELDEKKVPKATGGLKDACWKGYTAVGMKMKNGKSVPNCVPVKEDLDEGMKPYVSTTSPKLGEKGSHDVVDKSGKVVKSYPHSKEGMMAAQAHLKKMNESEQISEGVYEKAEENKRSADAAKKQGNMFDHHLHMADHHDNMSEWHSSRGRHGEADKHAAKAEQHQELAMKHKTRKEEVELEEQAPTAPSIVRHRISVTVSEPDHPMVSKRKEQIQKTVVVPHSGDKNGAKKAGENYYKKRGYRVHSSEHIGLKEATMGQVHTPSTHAGSTFSKTKPLQKSVRDIAAAAERRAGSITKPKDKPVSSTKKSMDAIRASAERRKMKEEVEEIDERNKENAIKRKMMDASRGARWKTQNKMSGDAVRDWDGKHKTPQAQNKAIGRALRNEDLDEKIDMNKADMGDVIKDFKKSDAPQFAGKSKEKRRQMAIAAKLQADRVKKEETTMKSYKQFIEEMIEILPEEEIQEETQTNEGWDDMLKAAEKRKAEKGTGKFDSQKTSTGTRYTRKSSTFVDDEGEGSSSDGPKKRGRKAGVKVGSYKKR